MCGKLSLLAWQMALPVCKGLTDSSFYFGVRACWSEALGPWAQFSCVSCGREPVGGWCEPAGFWLGTGVTQVVGLRV